MLDFQAADVVGVQVRLDIRLGRGDRSSWQPLTEQSSWNKEDGGNSADR